MRIIARILLILLTLGALLAPVVFSGWGTGPTAASDPVRINDLTAQFTVTAAGDLQATEQVMDYVRTHVPVARKAPLAGNTIGTDRSFLARDMPALEAHVHYRNVDVSSLKELARRWYPRAYYNTPAKNGNHRALADICESIEELRYYREAIFVAPPGPPTAVLREIALRHETALTSVFGAPDAGLEGKDFESSDISG